MPLKKYCLKQGCKTLIDTGKYCDDHKSEAWKQDEYRESSAKRGYDSQWRKARVGFLRKHPLCVHCKGKGILTEATVVDHIQPHKGDKELFWDRLNWQPLCASCHGFKTATEDGGFGNNIIKKS